MCLRDLHDVHPYDVDVDEWLQEWVQQQGMEERESKAEGEGEGKAECEGKAAAEQEDHNNTALLSFVPPQTNQSFT